MSSSLLRDSAELDSEATSTDLLARYWRLALLSFVGWSLLAAIPTTSAYIGTGARDPAIWWAMFKKIGLYYYLWGLLTPLLYRLTGALPYRGRGLAITLPTHLAVLVILSFGLGFMTHQDAWREWLLGPRALGYHSMSAFTYLLVVLCSLSIRFYRLSLLRERQAKDARVHAAQLDNQLNVARVESLRMQMNPHFLFNALNSVGALIETDQRDKAYEAVEQLADLLRRALALSQGTEVSLAKELGFIEAYLALEQIRFGDRLNVQWQIADEAKSCIVPAFVLQPLVENAIKHAVGPSASPVTVSIAASVTPGSLELAVSDVASSAPSGTGAEKIGVGLANLRERLRLCYGNDAAVNARTTQNGYCTTLSIPLVESIRST